MRSLVLAAFLALLSVPAFAADPPNLLGTWIPFEHSGARVGPREGYATSTTPVLSHDLHLAWKLVIESQDGPAFAGHNMGPSGKSTQVVGVIRADGTRFVMATEGVMPRARSSATGSSSASPTTFRLTSAPSAPSTNARPRPSTSWAAGLPSPPHRPGWDVRRL